MNTDDIKALIQLVIQHNIAELEVEEKGVRIRICGPRPAEYVVADVSAGPQAAQIASGGQTLTPQGAQANPPTAAAEAEAAGEAIPPGWKAIVSPMVGTFYRAPAPDAKPYVQVGDEVKEGTVLCIVEAMKLMNEIKAERRCRILKVLVDNGHPVEYGQPLFAVEPL